MSIAPGTAEETISIDAAGEAVAVDLRGHSIVSIAIRGDATAEYEVDARRRQGSWLESVADAYTGASDYDDVLETGVDELRVRCSTGTSGSNDEATITIMTSG